jgi:hypothetical protein
VLTRLPAKSAAPLVAEFAAWAREQCGLAETTLGNPILASRHRSPTAEFPNRNGRRSIRPPQRWPLAEDKFVT